MDILNLIINNKALVSFILALLSSPFMLKLLDKIITIIITREPKNSKEPCIKLKDSELFYVLKKSAWDIKHSIFINDYKTVVGRDLLRAKFVSSLDTINNWLIENNDDVLMNLSKEETKTRLFELIKLIIKNYEKKWEELELPVKVTEQFNKYHRGNVQWVLSTIEMLSADSSLTNIHFVYYAFKSLSNGYNRAFFDAYQLFKDMNGSLIGQKYKGIICD